MKISEQIRDQEDFRGLTLIRPWPSAIFESTKRIENRSWKPWKCVIGKFIAIHSGQKYDKQAAQWMSGNGLYTPPENKSCPSSCIVGVARVVDCLEYTDLFDSSIDPWFFGKFGWILDDVVKLSEPVACKGAMGLWRIKSDMKKKIISLVEEVEK